MNIDINPGLWALVAVAIGLLAGEIGGSLIRASMGHKDRSQQTRNRARAAASGVFWGSIAVGLVIAAGILDPDALETFTDSIGNGLPQVLLALVVVIVGYAIALGLGAAVGQSALKATGVRQVSLVRALKVSVVAISVVVAMRLGGVDDQLIFVMFLALIGAPAIAISLLTAFGGSDVARQIAAGRALSHQISVGWRIEVDDLRGEILSLHSTFVEIRDYSGGEIHHLPNRWLLERPFQAGP